MYKTTLPVLTVLEIPPDSEDGVLPPEVHNAQNKSKWYTWKDGSLAMNDVSTRFSGSTVLPVPADIEALKSPLQFFRYF